MKKRTIRLPLVAASMLFLLAVWLGPALAQDVGGFDETFDEGQAEGWERSEGVTIENGTMRIFPGNFAARLGGSWSDLSLSARLQFSGSMDFRMPSICSLTLGTTAGCVLINRRSSRMP